MDKHTVFTKEENPFLLPLIKKKKRKKISNLRKQKFPTKERKKMKRRLNLKKNLMHILRLHTALKSSCGLYCFYVVVFWFTTASMNLIVKITLISDIFNSVMSAALFTSKLVLSAHGRLAIA